MRGLTEDKVNIFLRFCKIWWRREGRKRGIGLIGGIGTIGLIGRMGEKRMRESRMRGDDGREENGWRGQSMLISAWAISSYCCQAGSFSVYIFMGRRGKGARVSLILRPNMWVERV